MSVVRCAELNKDVQNHPTHLLQHNDRNGLQLQKWFTITGALACNDTGPNTALKTAFYIQMKVLNLYLAGHVVLLTSVLIVFFIDETAESGTKRFLQSITFAGFVSFLVSIQQTLRPLIGKRGQSKVLYLLWLVLYIALFILGSIIY